MKETSPVSTGYEIHEADAFDWLQDREAETLQAVVTDPPYGLVEYTSESLLKRANGKGGIWRLPQSYDGQIRRPAPRFTVLRKADHDRISDFHRRLAPLLLRSLVPGAHVFIASQNILSHLVIGAFAGEGFEIRGQVVRVVKTLRGGDRPKGAHKQYPELSVTPRSWWEPWLIFRKPCEGRVRDNLRKWKTGALRRPGKSTPFSDVILSSPARKPERDLADHPSLKPQAFMRQITRASLPFGEGVLLDPFMGSGATIAAAEYLGYQSIGLEHNSSYFELAKGAIPNLASYLPNGQPGFVLPSTES